MAASKHWVGSFSRVQGWLRYTWLVALLSGLRLNGWPHFQWVLVAGVLISLIAKFLPTRATVGSDGLLLQWLFLRRFVPFSIVEHVALTPVKSKTKDGTEYSKGERLDIETSSGPSLEIETGRHPRELFDALVAARRARVLREQGAFDARALRAEGAGEQEWLARLRALAGRVQGFRVDAPTRDELLALVDDPTADEEARAGAAVVLGARSNEMAVERLRIAREETASPRLRVVIDAAMEADDEALVEALAEVTRKSAP